MEPQLLLLLHQLPHLLRSKSLWTPPPPSHYVGQALSADLSDTVGEHDHAPHVAVGHLHLPHRVLYDWTARIVFKKFELGVPFSLVKFLKTPTTGKLVATTLVGTTH